MGKKIRDSKWLYMVLSLLLAVILWMYVMTDLNPEDTKTLYNVPVVFTGLDTLEERGLTISEGANQTVTLSLQATRSVLQQLNNENVSVAINVSNKDTGVQTEVNYTPTYPRSVSNDPITIRSRSPSVIQYTISKWVTREIEVRGSFTGSVAEGFQKGELSISPSTITVSGQEDVVNQIDYAQVVLSQTELSETYTGELPFALVGFNGEAVSAEGLELSSQTVMVTLPVVQLKEVKLTVEVVPGGGATQDDAKITISPESIMVSGGEDDLESLTEISLGQIELQKIFGTDQITFKIPLDESLTNVSGVSEATVTVSISGLATRTIEVDNIQVIEPDGYHAELVTTSRLVMIRGSQDAVDQVIPSQIRIVADLSEMGEESIATGTQTVPVKVYLDGTGDVGVVGTDYNVTVTITR